MGNGWLNGDKDPRWTQDKMYGVKDEFSGRVESIKSLDTNKWVKTDTLIHGWMDGWIGDRAIEGWRRLGIWVENGQVLRQRNGRITGQGDNLWMQTWTWDMNWWANGRMDRGVSKRTSKAGGLHPSLPLGSPRNDPKLLHRFPQPLFRPRLPLETLPFD